MTSPLPESSLAAKPGGMVVAVDSSSAEILGALFLETFGEQARAIEPLRADGSLRRLFRIRGERRSVIGVQHDKQEENEAFIGFSRHFRALGLPVPEIFASNLEHGAYLETDLGDETLSLRIARAREESCFPDDVLPFFRETIRWLVRFQTLGAAGLDLSLCYQGRAFDAEAMGRDVAYFRECFLDLLSPVPYDPDALRSDFDSLIRILDAEERRFFLYRDFQSRNVVIFDGRPFFIDYQSGRKGAPEYDLASLLYDGGADLDDSVREELLDLYLGEMSRFVPLNRPRFLLVFPAFVLIRILQALGAYGNLGVRLGKVRFLESIPRALGNARSVLGRPGFPLPLPELRRVLTRTADAPRDWRFPAS